MKKKVLLLADPDSIHTKKWTEGWKIIRYEPIVSGISSITQSSLIIKSYINPRGGNGLVYLKNILKFKNILYKIDPIILNAHYMSSYGLIASLIKRKNDFLIMSVHGSDVMLDMDKNKIYLYMARYIFNKSDIIVSVSKVMTDKILKYFPYLKNKIITQQYGVDINFLNRYKNVIKDIDISTNRQWKPNSNYPILLETLSKFSKKNLKIIGSYNDKYSNALLNKYPELKMFSTGIIPYDINLKYIARSKIFISLTSSDGIPLSVIEAMYLGAIPIVSNIPSNIELVKDGINGFLVDIDKKALKEKIDYVLNLDENILNNIRENNKKLVLEKFDLEKNFNKLNVCIKKVLNG